MTFAPNIKDRVKGHLAKIWAKLRSTWSRWKRYLNLWNGNNYFAVYIYIFFICVHQMLACEIRRIQWKTWTHFLLSFLFDKDVYKFPFFCFFFNNLSPESKGGLNYFYLFSLYRERVGFITLIYFTFLLSPRQQTVSSASSCGCMFNARVISATWDRHRQRSVTISTGTRVFILGKESVDIENKLKEAVYIKDQRPTSNRGGGFKLSAIINYLSINKRQLTMW